MGEEAGHDTTNEDVVFNKDGTIRQKAGRKPKMDPEELTQLEQNTLLENLPNIEMLFQAGLQACILLRQKDQLERQVDVLERQAHDLRISLDREQQRLAEAKTTRMEYARG